MVDIESLESDQLRARVLTHGRRSFRRVLMEATARPRLIELKIAYEIKISDTRYSTKQEYAILAGQ